MTTFKVVCLHIFSNSLPCFSDIVVLGQIGFLVLETPEPSFNHDIISPAAFTIHALTNLYSGSVVSQQDDSGTICLKFTLKQVVCDIACTVDVRVLAK